MEQKMRFGDYINEVSVQASKISYTHLMPAVKLDSSGKEIPFKPSKISLRSIDIYRLLQPYVSIRFFDQFRAVFPLAVYLGLFQWLVLRQTVKDSAVIAGGLAAVIFGLMLFMEGLKLGLMPFGEIIGDTLPKKLKLAIVLSITFALGVGVTFAEPAIGALQVAGSIVDPNKAPYLYTLLTDRSWATVLIIGISVGFAAVLGTLRFIYSWSLKPLIYWTLIPTLMVSVYSFFHPELSKTCGLAWDCGGVTTGPVTVPLLLALGIGVASAVGKGSSSLSGFGIVTLASILPVLGVLLFGNILELSVDTQSIIKCSVDAAAVSTGAVLRWYEKTPGLEIVMGIRAIVPLILFLLFVLCIILHEKLPDAGITAYGIFLSIAGMILFNIGLSYGLAKLGNQSGCLVPAAFTRIDMMPESPLFSTVLGVFIAGLFAWLLGFGATLAEPALNALGITVENLTNGAFKKSLLIYSVCFGVATGVMAGVLKIIFNFHIMYIILPGYLIALVLTALSTEEFVNVGWDSAGVTTGPVTVPLVLAMGVGFGNALGVTDGFGILAAASVCPIVSVLALGLYMQYKCKRQKLKS